MKLKYLKFKILQRIITKFPAIQWNRPNVIRLSLSSLLFLCEIDKFPSQAIFCRKLHWELYFCLVSFQREYFSYGHISAFIISIEQWAKRKGPLFIKMEKWMGDLLLCKINMQQWRVPVFFYCPKIKKSYKSNKVRTMSWDSWHFYR
jgi:hypothetical protein